MAGYLLLEGGGEFGGQMAEPDRHALELAGGLDAPVSIIPTAAAPDNNHQRAGNNGVRWFRSLGATQVESLQVIDAASANDLRLAQKVAHARLIYMLGGFTGYLAATLKGSICQQAILEAYSRGAVIAGSSAGAMVLCQYYFDPTQRQIATGLAMLPNTCVLPHHNTFGKGWAAQLTALLPGAVLLGIDERTGLLDDGPAGRKMGWRVYGQGAVTLYRQGKTSVYKDGASFEDNFLA
jgi:cyanophycinase